MSRRVCRFLKGLFLRADDIPGIFLSATVYHYDFYSPRNGRFILSIFMTLRHSIAKWQFSVFSKGKRELPH